MNNILNFEQYREQVRLFEENLVKSQILQPLDESLKGKIRKKINAKAEVFVRAALADEIEMGRQLNEEIQSSVDDLKEYIEKIQEFTEWATLLDCHCDTLDDIYGWLFTFEV